MAIRNSNTIGDPTKGMKELEAAGFTIEGNTLKRISGIGTPTPNTINAGNITSGGGTNVPTPKQFDSTSLSKAILAGGNELSNMDFSSLTKQDVLGAQAGIMSRAFDLIKGTEGKADARRDEFRAEDIEGKQEAVTKYQNDLQAEQRALETTLRDLQKNPGGISSAGFNAKVQDIKNESLQRQADIAILGNAAANNLQTSLNLIDQRIELEFGPKEEALNTFRQQLEFASPFLGSLSSYLTEQADEEEKKLKEQRSYTNDLLSLAVEAQKAGNTALANKFTAMASQSDISFEDITQAQADAVANGVYTPRTSGSVSTVGILDAQRYNEAYPGANVLPGDTEQQANAKIQQFTTQPIQERIRSEVENLKNQNYSYDEARAAIIRDVTDPVIQRQTLAELDSVYKGTATADTTRGSIFDGIKSFFTKDKNSSTINQNSKIQKGFNELSNAEPLDFGMFTSLFKK